MSAGTVCQRVFLTVLRGCVCVCVCVCVKARKRESARFHQDSK